MDKYRVELNEQAQRDIEAIFIHIAVDRLAPDNAKAQTDRIYKKLKMLETFPYSHPKRTNGSYAGKDYRQLIIDNYLALYRVDEVTKTVHIVTIQYQSRNI